MAGVKVIPAMSQQDRIPDDLLRASIDDRVAYFETKMVKHPHLERALKALLNHMKARSGASMVFLLGPSGVGKTTLIRLIRNTVLKELKGTLEADPGRIPIVVVPAIPPDRAGFDWKEFYRSSLRALEEPLVEHKVRPGEPPPSKGTVADFLAGRRVGSELRQALERAIRFRRLDALIIDEAQHIAKTASGRKLLDQMDVIKSLADTTETLFVLVGTYRLRDFRNLSDQVSRRGMDIHFPRYRHEFQDDLKAFVRVLYSFQRWMPVKKEPNLVEHLEFCYERSIGCVGVLKDWLVRALRAAVEDHAPTITSSHLQRHALSIEQCIRMATEARQGEAAFEENEKARNQLLKLLHLATGASDPHQATMRLDERSATRDRGDKPGRRKPKRDLVGEAKE